MTEIMRFVLYDATVVSFYDYGIDTEILDVKYYPRVQTVDLSVDQFGKARLFTPGYKSYKAFNVTFSITSQYGADVQAKVKQLYDSVDSYFNPRQITMYWQYNHSATDKVYVMMKREQFVREYACGGILVRPLNIEFIEVNEDVALANVAINTSWITRHLGANLI